ncbi:MAG: helix-turn-helix domain-containing protein [Nitrospirota bacterium]
MEDSERERFYDVLELAPNASQADIREAYLHLKSLYTDGTYITAPLADEVPEEHRRKVLEEIETAYAALSGAPRVRAAGREAPPAEMDGKVQELVASVERFDGEALRRVREALGMHLGTIESLTKVRLFHLKNIERNRYETLPEAVYLRGYVKSLARCLALDPERVASDYMRGYEEWKGGEGCTGGGD